MEPEDEADISEISILPDGRICVFGASRQVMEALAVLNPDDPAFCRRIMRVRGVGAAAGARVEGCGVVGAAQKDACGQGYPEGPTP